MTVVQPPGMRSGRRSSPLRGLFADDTGITPAELSLARRWYDRQSREVFHEPVRAACPWCGSHRIGERIEVIDTRQVKPGRFRIDGCAGCGHLFQNPRLTRAGLAYYRRDSYDGLGREHYAATGAVAAPAHRARVHLLGARPRAGRWLDVGARHGHLAREVRATWPGTWVVGLDESPEIGRARERGWVDEFAHHALTAYRDTGPGPFDTITMIHHLEQVADPLADLAAAHDLLVPGGSLLIESVSPESVFSRLYGRWWFGWLAPHNLHLMPFGNLRDAVRDAGFEIVVVERGAANKPVDTVAALMLALNVGLPPAHDWPWLGRGAVRSAPVARGAVMALAAPAALVAAGIDRLLHLRTRRSGGGNTYRIVARRR